MRRERGGEEKTDLISILARRDVGKGGAQNRAALDATVQTTLALICIELRSVEKEDQRDGEMVRWRDRDQRPCCARGSLGREAENDKQNGGWEGFSYVGG